MAEREFEIIAEVGCQLAEGPVWHEQEGALYWTDIMRGQMWRWEEGKGSEIVYEGQRVGGFTVQADGSLLLFREGGNVVIWDKGEVRDVVVEGIAGSDGERFNDVYADPMGRVYAGTVCEGEMGRLIRLEIDGQWHELVRGVACSNGMDLTLDQGRMYYTDSKMRTIWSYGYEQSTGALHDRQVFVEVNEGEGVPDGLTVDKGGDVWSARWDGWGVYRYGDDGKLKEKVELPAKQVTSVCFGGKGYGDLFVTSAGCGGGCQLGKHAGSVFRVKADVVGKPSHFSRVCL
ncbi:SMP-30/gluconolactonase/LRE family protein [Planctomycetota bacterium]|nr:SMP-30/gluconolactonase/LRE family protein [Planctomycetota bacterium]